MVVVVRARRGACSKIGQRERVKKKSDSVGTYELRMVSCDADELVKRHLDGESWKRELEVDVGL